MRSPPFFFIVFSAVALAHCKPHSASITLGASQARTEIKLWCPKEYRLSHGLCLNNVAAQGPFPTAMVEACKKSFPDRAVLCNEKFPVDIALKLRGRERCPPGTTGIFLDAYCAEIKDNTTTLYGPFSQLQVSRCLTYYPNDPRCSSMKWDVKLAQQIYEAKPPAGIKKQMDVVPKKLVTSISKPSKPALDICQYRWSENPGYADYAKLQNSDLLFGFDVRFSDKVTLHKNLCADAKLVYSCFKKSLAYDNGTAGGKRFIAWAKGANIDPVLYKMSIAAQETHFGVIADDAVNGRGMMQLARPVTLDGFDTYVDLHDEGTWAGIEQNILSNIVFGTHMLGVKVKEGAANFTEIAESYNGNWSHDPQDSQGRAYATVYGINVGLYYDELQTCSLTAE